MLRKKVIEKNVESYEPTKKIRFVWFSTSVKELFIYNKFIDSHALLVHFLA
jgi:hypothetical protein